MAIEDLDLEFEEEAEIEKSDALDVDVDLDFSAHGKKAQAPKAPPQQAAQAVKKTVAPKAQAQKPAATSKPMAKVQSIQSHPKAQATSQVQARPTSQHKVEPGYYSDSENQSYELDQLRSELDELKEQMRDIKSSADLKVAVAEARSEYLVQYISDAKLMDHQVNQVLQRIHKKVPALKNDVLTIKKYITEFMNKNKK